MDQKGRFFIFTNHNSDYGLRTTRTVPAQEIPYSLPYVVLEQGDSKIKKNEKKKKKKRNNKMEEILQTHFRKKKKKQLCHVIFARFFFSLSVQGQRFGRVH